MRIGAVISLEPSGVPALQDEQRPETTPVVGATGAVLLQQAGDGFGPDKALAAQPPGLEHCIHFRA